MIVWLENEDGVWLDNEELVWLDRELEEDKYVWLSRETFWDIALILRQSWRWVSSRAGGLFLSARAGNNVSLLVKEQTRIGGNN